MLRTYFNTAVLRFILLMRKIFMEDLRVIAHIYNDYQEKFGIPRQSGLVEQVISRIVFEKEFSHPEAFRGLEEYDYIWVLWQFSRNHEKPWSATVKPPRLGGKKRMGVFATRSPYRPSNIGLSSVRLMKIDTQAKEGTVLYVAGADMLNGTPIYDIKPYLVYADSHPMAREGFAAQVQDKNIQVTFTKECMEMLPKEKQEAVEELLRQDPRPGYDNFLGREYKLAFGGYDISFRATKEGLEIYNIDFLNRADT